MKNIFFISDQHFSQRNFLNFTDSNGNRIRPFDSIDEMDEHMIERHNSVVGKFDKVWFGGDITFDRKRFDTIMSRLNGKKRLVLGNHDDGIFLAKSGWFEKIVLDRRFDEFGFIMEHKPGRLDQAFNHRQQKQMKIVHGHVHQNSIDDPNYINICVEVVNYTPVHLDEIIDRIKNS